MLDESRWPYVFVSFEDVQQDFAAVLDVYPRWLEKKTPFVTVLQAPPGATLEAPQRKQFAELLDKHRAELSRYMLRQAVIVESAISRGVITAILWLTSSPFEVKTFSRRADADAWVMEALDGRAQRAR